MQNRLTQALDFQSQALVLRAERQRLIASNIANAESATGPDGQTYEAIYTMERQPDGTWQINGCAIVRAPDVST